MKLQVNPIYGWGWRNKESAVEIPPPFELEAVPVKIDAPGLYVVGFFEQAQHPLSGHWIELQQRSEAVSGAVDCNLQVYHAKPIPRKIELADTGRPVITGFAMVQIETPTQKIPR